MNRDPWVDLGELARLAPTPHNRQPFRIRPLNARVAQVMILNERMLPPEDAGSYYVLSAFGILAETLERAGRHLGLQIKVTPSPDVVPQALEPGTGPVVLGRAEISGSCAAEDQRTLLEARRTSCLPYESRAVAPKILMEFSRIAAEHGHCFEVFDEPLVVRDIQTRNIGALLEHHLSAAPAARGPIRLTDAPAGGEGLWSEPLSGPPWLMHLAHRVPQQSLRPMITRLVRVAYLRTHAGTRHVAILRGPFLSWPELVGAGRLLMRLWLAMTHHGIYMAPFGAMISDAACHEYLRERFCADDLWFILRFGYSAVPPQAPRLASVLTGEDWVCPGYATYVGRSVGSG